MKDRKTKKFDKELAEGSKESKYNDYEKNKRIDAIRRFREVPNYETKEYPPCKAGEDKRCTPGCRFYNTCIHTKRNEEKQAEERKEGDGNGREQEN